MTYQAPSLSPSEFAAKWTGSTRNERAASQEHFIDLCRMLGVPTPNEADPTGDWYAFEKGAEKTAGGEGFADVWKRHHFGWEYKGKHKDLDAAYGQLLQYREALENPPLLVVCDLDRFVVHTNFTNTQKQTYRFALHDLRDAPAEPLRVLRAVFTSPEALRPQQTPAQITEAAAARFARIARSMQERGHDPERVAHFLNRILFCLFAEDAHLLPERIMSGLIESRRRDPAEFAKGLHRLFELMSSGGDDRYFGNLRIEWFNGGLFDTDDVLEFTADELDAVAEASTLDWSQVEPAILGTLFERGLDPDKRGQLGAHYTDREKILMVVEPVVMTPLRREFEAMQARVRELLASRTPAPFTRDLRPRANRPQWERDAEAAFFAFLARLRGVRVLDPACGSGNFLYVTLKLLKDLEKEASQWASQELRITYPQPEVGPHSVLGIELNPYAAELARVSIWIGHLQWHIENGFGYDRNPILKPLENIECRDAILAYDAEGKPRPAEWPEAEFIVGNPPFLGGNYIRASLGEYVDDLFAAWDARVPRFSDLVCYWHEKARAQIASRYAKRAGLLATNSIRGGANRETLQRIKKSGEIFLAWSDEPWIVDGAAVRVSIVGQDDGTETRRTLDGEDVTSINSDLTADVDVTVAGRLWENQNTCFMGPSAKAPFDIDTSTAHRLLAAIGNVNGRPNSDVVRRVVSAVDLVRRSREKWTIDFGAMEEVEASQYEAPFEYVREHVLPAREQRRSDYRGKWWQYARPRPEMRAALALSARFIATPAVAKHRLFAWMHPSVLCNQGTLVIARDDDYAFGVLHSRAHELWSLRLGTWLGKGNDPRYTPTTTFETFPFPWPLNTPDAALTAEQRAHRDAIGAAAKALDDARQRWLNPPELVRLEPDVVPSLPPRVVPVDEEAAKQLAKRTLTNLYNQRPAWLANLHRDLDRAVFAAYGWTDAAAAGEIEEEELLRRLLALNLERAAAQ